MAAELGVDAAGVQRRGADAAILVAAIELDGKEDVRGLGAAIGDPRIIVAAVEIGVAQIDVRETVPRRGEADQAAAVLDQRRDAVDESEVTQMIGAELRLEAIGGPDRKSTRLNSSH